MKFLVDECTGPAVARWLEKQGYDVYSVYDRARGITDEKIMCIAVEEGRILITNDKDFGQKVFRDGRVHCGIILLRLEDERAEVKRAVLERLLEKFSDRIEGHYLVANEETVRIAKFHSE